MDADFWVTVEYRLLMFVLHINMLSIPYYYLIFCREQNINYLCDIFIQSHVQVRERHKQIQYKKSRKSTTSEL